MEVYKIIVWCYKIIFGLVNIDVNNFLLSILFPILGDTITNFTNHTALEFAAISFVYVL